MPVLSQKSLNRLVGVHPDLVHVVFEAIKITKVDFVVIEGRRSQKRQAELVRLGKSWTMNGRHLTGHAVDLMALVGGKDAWEPWALYIAINTAMQAAATKLEIPIVWGGVWKQRDGVHWELDKRKYP